jgi:hypothetical protein
MFDLLCYFSNDSITCLGYKEAEYADDEGTQCLFIVRKDPDLLWQTTNDVLRARYLICIIVRPCVHATTSKIYKAKIA